MPAALPALPPMPHNVVPMTKAKPAKGTVTITGPDGKTSGPVDIDALEKLATKLEANHGLKRPGKRPQITVDPEEVAKLEKALGDEAVAALRECDHAELRSRIVALSEHEVETEQGMKRDDRLQELKDEIREVQAPYKETIKSLKLRRRLAVLLMQERGRPLG